MIALLESLSTIVPMNMARHFSDTRTDEGRVRFLLSDQCVLLLAEGPGWQHSSRHDTMHDATNFLALLSEVSYDLYLKSLQEVDQRIRLEVQAA